MVVEDLPERFHIRICDVAACGKERVMEVGQGALLVGGLSKVVPKPFALGRRLFAPAHLVAVEGQYVPGSPIIGVVALAWGQSRVRGRVGHRRRGLLEANGLVRAEVVEVGLRYFGRVVLMVAEDGHRASFVLTPPGGAIGIEDTTIGDSVVIVTVGVLPWGAVGVGVISESEDSAQYVVQQSRSCLGVVALGALGYVPRSDQRHRLRLRGARRGRQQGRHACQQHRRGYSTDNKNTLAHPLHPSLCGVKEKSENPRPAT